MFQHFRPIETANQTIKIDFALTGVVAASFSAVNFWQS